MRQIVVRPGSISQGSFTRRNPDPVPARPFIFPQDYRVRDMNSGRIIVNIGFWILFSFFFDAVSGALFPDLTMESYLMVWFFGLFAGTILFNLGWYWFTIRR